MARRWVREQSGQNRRCRPFSTATVQVRASAGLPGSPTRPQKSQVTGWSSATGSTVVPEMPWIEEVVQRPSRNRRGRVRRVVVPGLSPRLLVLTAGRAGPAVVSQGASESESRLLRGLLGLAAEPAGQEQLVPLTPRSRLSQARGHLRPREFFVHEIHVSASVPVGLHVCLSIE